MVTKTLWTLILCCLTVTLAETHAPYPPMQKDTGYAGPVRTYSASASSYESPQASVYSSAENTYGIQTGYEGFLSPVESSALLENSGTTMFDEYSSLFDTSSGLSGPLVMLTKPWFLNIFPVLGKIAGKLGLWLLGFSMMVLIGGGFTVAVCTFTPICTLTFPGFGHAKENLKETMRAYITKDKLNYATRFVMEAIDKYHKLQGKSLKEKIRYLSKPLTTKTVTTPQKVERNSGKDDISAPTSREFPTVEPSQAKENSLEKKKEK